MAGRERSGPGAARADLFEGRPWAVSSTGADERSMARVRALLDLCGAVVVEMDAPAHDAAVALVSHVPQVAASLVAARLAEGDDAALALTGQGLRDVTRVAASDPDLWVDILAANAEPVARILTELRQDVDAVVHALREVAEDPEWARTVAARGPAPWQRRPGPAARQARRPLHDVRAGAGGARPTARASSAGCSSTSGAAGVNIEDIRIEHSPGQPVGLVELAVAPAAAGGLAAALAGLGWVVHAEGA